MTLLSTESLSMTFGGLRAVSNLSLQLEMNDLQGLIGPNGAGKTTVFNMLSGMIKPTTGKVIFDGEDITNLPAHQITQRGMARTFQNIRLFGSLTVLENVKIAFHRHVTYSFMQALLQLNIAHHEENITRSAMDLLDVLGLADRAHHQANNLSYGEQRLVEIARAMATQPKLLLLDEPAAGMNPHETEQLMNLIGKIRRDFDLSVLLIEHDMNLVMGICERITVLDYGMTIAEGSPEQVRANPRVIEAYLGEEVV